MAKRLYVDSSSIIRIATGDHDGPELEKLTQRYTMSGSRLVSSKLLELECRRATIRLEKERRGYPEIERLAGRVRLLPMTDEVWEIAMKIPQIVKTLDALHLATCSLVPDCRLLTSDANMRAVAPQLGIELA